MLSILYVDDEVLNLDLMQLIFKHDLVVYKALSGSDALELLKSIDVSILLTDYKMPGMSGVELIVEVKRLYPHLICMLLTGFDEMALEIEEDKRQLITSILQKPFRKKEFIEIINNASIVE